ELGAVDLFARAGNARRRVELSQRRIGLQLGIGVDAGARARAARAAGVVPRRGGAGPWRRGRHVDHALGRAAVALELRLAPVHGGAIPLCALASIAERRQPLDGRLVALEIEALDD